jgi:hypothetical protein
MLQGGGRIGSTFGLGAGVVLLTGSGVTRPLLVFSSCFWISAILDM